MFRSLFKKKEQDLNITAPMSGKVVKLEDVPDEVFSKKMMGDGIAIIPSDGQVFSPIEGEVVDVFRTKHAISLRSKDGAEFLIHMGLETVELNGEGFTVKVNNGDKVKKGTLLAEMDLEAIEKSGRKTITPVILMNGDDFSVETMTEEESVEGGTSQLLELNRK